MVVEKISIFYTNDLHSHFENWPSIIGRWKREYKRPLQPNETRFLLDVGDHMDRFHPISEESLGKSNVQILNKANYNCVTIGNNEGITLEGRDFYHLYDEAQFDVVCANISSQTEPQPSWLTPYQIYNTQLGTKIGIIGLTAPFTPFYHPNGWDVFQPLEILEKYIPILKKKADIIILLSHLGINEDEEIARQFPEINLIIGGHTHHLLKKGKKVGNTLLTAAGKFGLYTGEAYLTWNPETQLVEKAEAYATSIETEEKDELTEQMLKKLSEQAVSELNHPFMNLKKDLQVNWFEENELIMLLTEVMKKWTDSDVAMLNGGVLLEGLPSGPVSKFDLLRICPHPINPCKINVTGEELKEIVRVAFTKEIQNFELKGFGFRGKVIGRMMFSGIDVQTSIDSDGEERVKHIQYRGAPVDPNQRLSLCVPDTFTFGYFFPEIVRAPDKQYFLPEMLRDLLKIALLNE
ncbi:bifunctional UDP-sugar hydrolase/5'-nucleotidase [Bacillaceae bacterium S4-13-58]